MLKIHESFDPGGGLSAIYVAVDAGALVLLTGEERRALPAGALDAVMARYGAALDPGEPLAGVAELPLGGGRVLRHVRHLARFDVIAKDYLVYETPGKEPRCALATSVAAALAHLADAAARAG